MSAALLLEKLCADGIRLQARGEKLNIRGPEGRLVPALMDRIKTNKAGLMELIRDLPVGTL